MAEYIEKQAVLDEIDEEIQEFPECEYALSFSKRWIKKLPPADVRPVVYCKDCDEAKRNTVDGAIYCSVWDYWEMPEKGFCHYGSSIMKDGD